MRVFHIEMEALPGGKGRAFGDGACGSLFNRLLKKWFFTGWSKTFRCKAREIKRNEAYVVVRRNDER